MCETEYGRLIACMQQRRGDRASSCSRFAFVAFVRKGRGCALSGTATRTLDRDELHPTRAEPLLPRNLMMSISYWNVEYIECMLFNLNNGRLAQLVRAFV